MRVSVTGEQVQTLGISFGQSDLQPVIDRTRLISERVEEAQIRKAWSTGPETASNSNRTVGSVWTRQLLDSGIIVEK